MVLGVLGWGDCWCYCRQERLGEGDAKNWERRE